MHEAFLHVSLTGSGRVLFEAVRTKYTSITKLITSDPTVRLGPPLIVELPFKRIHRGGYVKIHKSKLYIAVKNYIIYDTTNK